MNTLIPYLFLMYGTAAFVWGLLMLFHPLFYKWWSQKFYKFDYESAPLNEKILDKYIFPIGQIVIGGVLIYSFFTILGM